MKSGRIFWGALFTVVGVLLLLERFDVLNLEWYSAWRYWPLLLVFWGIALLVKDPRLKWIVALAGAVVAGILLINVGGFAWTIGSREGGREYDQEFTEPLGSGIKNAELSLEAVAGTFIVKDTTGQLISASTKSSIGQYRLEADTVGETAKVRLALEGKRAGWHGRRASNRADVRLNAVPAWNMDFDIGAARLDLDLEPFVTENIRINAGAASVRLRLGARAKETHLDIDAGASSIRISVPNSSACETRFDGALSSKNLPDFDRIDSKTYRTDNFATADHKIFINVDSGVSGIRVVRY